MIYLVIGSSIGIFAVIVLLIWLLLGVVRFFKKDTPENKRPSLRDTVMRIILMILLLIIGCMLYGAMVISTIYVYG